MKKAKLSELWQEVESSLAGDKTAGIKFAILEAHKILENTLRSQGYPGKTLKKQLYWAGYSLEDEDGIKAALEKRDDILRNFDYDLSSLEAEEIIKMYKKIVHEIVTKPKFSFKNKLKAFYKIQLNPKSILFWRNLGVIVIVLCLIKILAYTEFGKVLLGVVVAITDLVISWISVAAIMFIVIIVLLVNNYLDKKSKILIKE